MGGVDEKCLLPYEVLTASGGSFETESFWKEMREKEKIVKECEKKFLGVVSRLATETGMEQVLLRCC